MIHARASGMKLRVFCLDTEPFDPDGNEIQLYGRGGGNMYAFESVDITLDTALEIVDAILWYASYIECPELSVTAEDPRPLREIAI
jgi:hypothetical protein